MSQLEAEKNALYDEVRTARRLVVTEGHQHLSGAGVQEIVSYFVKEKQKLESEQLKQTRKVSSLLEEIDQLKFEFKKRESPSAKRQDLEGKLLSIEEAISKKRLDYDTVAERLAVKSGRRYHNPELAVETYKENVKALQDKSEEDKLKLKQQVSVQAGQYEKEIDRLRHLLKTHSTSTEALNVSHEGHINKLKSEKESLSKSLSSVKNSYESLKGERGELETVVQNLKLELSHEVSRNLELRDTEKTRVSSNSRHQTELKIQLKTAEDGCKRRDDMIKELKLELTTLQSDIEILQESKKKLSTQAELFALTEEKGKQRYELQTSTYEIEIEKLKHQVAHKEEVLMNAQDMNVSLQQALRHTRDEAKSIKDKLEQADTSSSINKDTLEREVEQLNTEIQELTDKYEETISNSEEEAVAMRRRLGDMQGVLKQTETETKQLKVSLEHVQTERDEVEVYNSDLLSRLSDMECEKKQLSESLGEQKGRSGRRNMELECKISELKEELSAVRDESALLKEEIEEQTGQNSSILELNKNIKSKLELTVSQLSDKKTELDALSKKHSQTERELIGLTSKLDSTNQDSRLTSTEVVKLSQKLAHKSEEVQSCQEQAMHERRLAEERIHKLETTLVTSKTEDKKTIEFLEMTKAALSNQVEVLNIEIDSLKRDTGDQSGALKGLRGDNDKLKLKLNELGSSLETERKGHKLLKQTNTQHEFELKDLKQELKSIQSQLIHYKQSADEATQDLSQREQELSEMGRRHNERLQELDQLKMTHSVLSREKEKSDEKLFQLELKLSDLTDSHTQLEAAHSLAVGRQEKDIDFYTQSEEYKRLYAECATENKVLRVECGILRESLEHFKGNDRQQLTQMSTFQQSIADAKTALKTERAKTMREHEKCKKWQTEYKTIQTTCDTMHGDIVSLLGKLSSAEMELESSNQRMEDRKKSSISKLEGSLEKISEEKGRCEKSVSSLEDKISHLQTSLEKEHQWKETADELHQSILRDKSQLIGRYSELESELNEHKLAMKMRDLNIKKLQKENAMLETKYREALECGQKMWH